MLQAAVEAGVRRVILCSSINAVNGYPRDRQVRASDVPFPGNIYGATKAFSEALAGAFVSLHPGFSAIAVRIGGVRHPDQMRARPAPEQSGATVRPGLNLEDARSVVVTLPDLSRLFDRCLGAGPEVTFAVVNGISRNRHLRMDLEETRRLVGYEPQDDAFADWQETYARRRRARGACYSAGRASTPDGPGRERCGARRRTRLRRRRQPSAPCCGSTAWAPA